MRREERRRKLHETLLNTLYPPPQAEDEQKPPASTLTEGFDVDLIPGLFEGVQNADYAYDDDDDDDDAGFGEGGGGEGECGSRKLTRAQRKRLRKKKLREDISRRSKIIGPLLPPSIDAAEEDAPNVRENAEANSDSSSKKPGTSFSQDFLFEKKTALKKVISYGTLRFVLDSGGEGPSAGSGNDQSKTKHRRMAKKLAKAKLRVS